MTVKKGGLMEDMISRNDAYNTLTEYYHHTTEIQHKALREALERVPDSQPELIGREAYIRGFEQGKTQGRLDTLSAQPEKRTEERTETHACDCISRKDAIDAHYEYCNKHPDAGFPVWSLKILEDLPSAQSERQKGEWIDYTEDGYVECPFCHSATNCDGNKDELHFCFSCGADMRKPEDIPMEYFESGGR